MDQRDGKNVIFYSQTLAKGLGLEACMNHITGAGGELGLINICRI